MTILRSSWGECSWKPQLKLEKEEHKAGGAQNANEAIDRMHRIALRKLASLLPW